MIKKITTMECVLFLTAHYAQKNIETKIDEWELKKKYKDLKNNTCRDFYHEELGLEAIVVYRPKTEEEKAIEKQELEEMNFNDGPEEDISEYTLEVMENASFMIFVREKQNKATYYFAPFVNNNGFMLYIEDGRRFDQFQKFETKPRTQKPYVLASLKNIFKDKEIVSLREDNMFVSFPSMNIDDVCKTLLKKHWRFAPEFFEGIQSSGYSPYHPEIEYVKFSFPEHKVLDRKGVVDTIYEMVASEIDWKKENYAKLQSLLEKISIEELLKIKKSVVDLQGGNDKKLISMMNAEINKKRSFLIFHRIAAGNLPEYKRD